MSQTIVISAGRNIQGKAMTLGAWEQFHEAIERELDARDAHYFTKRALGLGDYEGEGEDSVTYVVSIETNRLSDIERNLGKLAGLFEQDSIVIMTVAQTIFCG